MKKSEMNERLSSLYKNMTEAREAFKKAKEAFEQSVRKFRVEKYTDLVVPLSVESLRECEFIMINEELINFWDWSLCREGDYRAFRDEFTFQILGAFSDDGYGRRRPCTIIRVYQNQGK